MKDSEEFIDLYNKIDKFIKEFDGFESNDSFAFKIKHSKNKVVNRYKDDLISYGELRNAIVHNPKIGNYPIAEPHKKTVEILKDLYNKITRPEKVIPVFQFIVLGANEDDYINDILIEMKKKSFSQFPVFDANNHVIELINTNTIARWVSEKLEENGSIMIENIKIKDLIPEIEFNLNFKFISRETSIYEAYDLFLNQIIANGRNLDVLFITNSGKATEELLGLITIEDIAPKVQRLASVF